MDVKLLNSACRLAVEVARAGLLGQPSVPAPTAMHRVLTFKRFSQTTFAAIRKVVDDDDDFRRRVAGAAEEHDVGRAGWLWLHRPDGWEAEAETLDVSTVPATAESASRLRKKLEAAEAVARRHAAQVEVAEAARLRADQKLAEVVDRSGPALARHEALEAEVARLGEERTRVVRLLKETEADLATTRRELKLVRQANVEAHAELMALQQQPVTSPAPYDSTAVRHAVGQATQAAATLSAALADAASALVSASDVPPSVSGSSRKKRRTTRRPLPTLPPGVFGDSVEANRHLVTTASLTVVVDAYNVARTAWSAITPEEERRRTVALLEEVQARSGATVVAMFDGDSTAVAPVASRSVRVQFSPTGVTADDAIADLLAALPVSQPVLVVSSDKAVARDARRQGAAVMASDAFLTATGR